MDINKAIFKYGVYYPSVMLNGSNVGSSLATLQKSQYFSAQQLETVQTQKLIALIDYAKKHIPHFYGVNRIQSLSDLQTLPFMSKEIIRNNGTELRSTETFKNLIKKSTGGSTGAPMTVFKEPSARTELLAAMWRGYSWLNVDIGDKRGQFWTMPSSRKGKLIAKISDFIVNRRRCSAFQFDENDLHAYTKTLERFNPKYLYGYSSMLAQYAEYLLRIGYLPKLNLTGIITTSEVLDESRRNIIETAFKVKVFDEYGCGEIGTIAHECEYGSMHINSENLIVEIIDDNGFTCNQNEIGNVVITELNNRAMPLIRYQIKDLAAQIDGSCKCGRGLPLMTHPEGRTVEYLKHKSGKKFYGSRYTLKLVEESKLRKLGISQLQLVQQNFNDFVLKVKPESEYNPEWTKEFISKEIKKDFGSETTVAIEIVNNIKRSKSGKASTVICMI